MGILSSLFSSDHSDSFARIKQHIRKSNYGIEKPDKHEIIELVTPTIGVKTRSESDSNLEIGTSKIGGNPDLPKDFKWPRYHNENLTFCAQYNVCELKKFDLENKLPEKGMFYVFVFIDSVFMTDESTYKLVYVENMEDIQRLDFPKKYFLEGKIESAKIDYFQYFTLPDWDNSKMKRYEDKYEDFGDFREDLIEFIDDLSSQKADNYHQVLGRSRSVQSSVMFYFAAKKLQVKTIEDYKIKEFEIHKISNDYNILLQLDCNDSNSNLNRFGGSSTLYFGIEPEDLKKKNFENVTMVSQGT